MSQYQFTDQEKQERKDFQEAAALCMWLFQNPDYLSKPNVQDSLRQLKEFLEDTWISLCQFRAARFKGWTADTKFKGYLIIKSSSTIVRVPYHLADFFPNGEALEELCRIASRVQVAPDGVICISGSSTYLEALKYIADIDYCEYAPLDKNDGWCDRFVNILYESLKKQENQLICVKGVIFDSERKRISTIRHNETTSGNARLSHARLDFIALFLEKVIEVTNLVLPIDRMNSKDDPTLEKSFALQEAPVNEGNWIPQQLLNPLSLGTYADFLREEVQKKKEEEPIKAAKRALSLARIIGFWQEGDSIINVLVQGDLIKSAAFEARKALEPILDELRQRNPQVAENLLNKLDETLRNLYSEDATKTLRDDSIEVLQGIFDKLLDKIQIIVEQVKPNV